VNLGGNAAQIAAATTPAGAARHVSSLTLTIERGITVNALHNPAVQIMALEITRGPTVRVTNVRMLQTARGVGFLVSFFGRALQGVPPDLAARVAERESETNMRGVTSEAMNAVLTVVARRAVAAFAEAHPELNVNELVGAAQADH
jgi:hypothetical protein